MAVAATPSPSASSGDWKKKTSLRSALIQIGIAAVLFGGVVFFVYQRGATKKESKDGVDAVRTLALRDNPKDLQAALTKVQALLKEYPTLANAHALAADIQTEQWLIHRLDAAQMPSKAALAQAEAGDATLEERVSAKTLQLLADGKATEAEQYLESLRQQGRNSARIWYALGLVQQQLGRLDLARQALMQAYDKSWRDPRFSSAIGEQLLLEGQFAQAIEMLTKGLTVNPEHFRSRLALSLAQLRHRSRMKDVNATLTEIEGRQEELTPGLKARFLAVKAERALAEGKTDDAIQAANDAIALNDKEGFALLAKARALAVKKEPAATVAFQAAIAEQKTAPLFYLDGAQMLQAAGEGAGALAILDAYEAQFKEVTLPTADGKTVNALDRDDRYWIARGDVLRQQNRMDDALAAYDKAIAAGSVNLAKAHYAKAQVFVARNQQDKALETLLLIAPADGSGGVPDAYVSMGELLFQKKQYAEGCQQFAYALTGYRKVSAPREKLTTVLDDVHKRLVSAGQKPMAKLWMDEAKPLAQ